MSAEVGGRGDGAGHHVARRIHPRSVASSMCAHVLLQIIVPPEDLATVRAREWLGILVYSADVSLQMFLSTETSFAVFAGINLGRIMGEG